MAEPKSLIGIATFFFFIIIITTCVCVLSNTNEGLSDEEAAYLLKLRDNLSPLGSYWLDNTTKCDWNGVQCSSLDSTNSRYIEGIDLSSKGLTGTIPSGLNHSLLKLTNLNLAHNFLTGPLPSLAITSLQYVDLSLNNFSSIPHGFFQALYYVEDLALANNTNLPPWTFPANFAITSLQSLDLSATNLEGSLPDMFHSFPDLINLDLSGNNLTGMLPESFAKLLKLQNLYLSNPKDNKLSGTIQVLSSMLQLYDVNLEGNSFEGSIPDLSHCTNLRFLVLANNRLTGVVPVSLGHNNKQIWQVSLENNWLQGPLPLFNKTRTPLVSLGGNGFCLNHSGPCDHRVTTLLQVADAFGYPFLLAKSWRGNNPCQGWDFITCGDNGNIRTVNLTDLNLMGTISPAFQNLTDLYELYLGGNKLSGSIPESLTTLQHLKILDVSNNNLSGNIPPFSTRTIVITTYNALLGQPDSQANSPSKSPLSPASIVGILTGGIGVAVVFVAIVYNHKRCFNLVKRILLKKERLSEQKVEELLRSYGTSTPVKYSYAEVKQMTNTFHEELGHGGYGIIYKASLNDGRQVAVKVLKESKGSVEEFVNEVVIISRTSHVNIVSLLGFCYEMDKRALIYEFLPNGSLDKFIYKKGSSSHLISNLDWSTLYAISISVARGLDYLHRGCNTRILHLDIKPQNILLDENFCPKIADFGLAKICKMDESIVSILGTRGTPGYIAPEMFSRMYGGVSHKSDVYSYGMLILEMIGGRRNDETGGESHSSDSYFPNWIYKDLEKGNIQTRSLANGEEENDIVTKITLVSLWCIQINPSNRPSMSKVVEMLAGPLQSVPYPPKPVISSPTSTSLQFSDAAHSSLYETNSTEQVNGSVK